MPEFSAETSPLNRSGCHYFPDSEHYTQRDLGTWLPELRRLGFSWLSLTAPARRAIPEDFLTGLIEAGITPVLRFGFSLKEPAPEGFEMLCESYARWDVRYVDLFTAPNLRASWPPAAWAHSDLVERFLDRFLPLAEAAFHAGLTPLFPCLDPGGDYWDLPFLQQGLAGVQRRAPALARSLALAAHISLDRPLSWGSGGPESWPAARPYFTPATSQDHRSFRIYEWYSALAQAKLGFNPPIFLFSDPSCSHPAQSGGSSASDLTASRRLAATRLLYGLSAEEDGVLQEAVSKGVTAGCLWLLSAAPGSPQAASALFPLDGEPHPSVKALRELAVLRDLTANSAGSNGFSDQPYQEAVSMPEYPPSRPPAASHPVVRAISHYLLIPAYDWGMDEISFARLLPFIRQHRPTIGFSLVEARMAQRVSIAGGLQAFPDEALSLLQNAGCLIERLLPDGTIIAS